MGSNATERETAVVEAWVDGACDPNPGKGGWGVVLECKSQTKELKGGTPKTTNNRMELQAAIEALSALNTSCRVRIYSDSAYLVNSMNGIFSKAKNQELWERLDLLDAEHLIEWIKVPAHEGKNQRAHELANEGMYGI